MVFLGKITRLHILYTSILESHKLYGHCTMYIPIELTYLKLFFVCSIFGTSLLYYMRSLKGWVEKVYVPLLVIIQLYAHLLVLHLCHMIVNPTNSFFLVFTDDPYYCGLRARVPNFVKTSNGKTKEIVKDVPAGPKISTAVPPSRYHQPNPMALSNGHLATMHYHHHTQPAMWHTRSFDSGMGE